MRVYCASPFTSTDPACVAENICHAQAVGQQVRALGHVPFVPHIALPAFPETMPIEAQWEPAMRECLSHLETCDAILLTGDWQRSRGCRAELAAAYGLKIRVCFTLDELREVAA